MEEKIRILNLLKEGKITTEEASNLLDALEQKTEDKEHHAHRIRFKKHFMPGIEVIPEAVTNAISTAMAGLEANFGTDFKGIEKRFPNKGNLLIRSVSGDIKVQGGEQNEVILASSGGMQKNQERDNSILFSSINNDINLKTPINTELSASSVSGDIEINNIIGNINCESVSGDLELENVNGKLAVRSASGDVKVNNLKGAVEIKDVSGDIEIKFIELEQGKIETKSGDIELSLPAKTDAILELSCEDGDIDISELEGYEEIDKKEGYLKIGLGKKTITLTVSTKSGDIEVKTEQLFAFNPGQGYSTYQ